MPPPQKGFKRINHRDTLYLWILQNRRGVNELVVEMSASVNGRKLIAELPRVVNHDMVTNAIDFALRNGWKPSEAGPDFRCVYAKKTFVIAE